MRKVLTVRFSDEEEQLVVQAARVRGRPLGTTIREFAVQAAQAVVLGAADAALSRGGSQHVPEDE